MGSHHLSGSPKAPSGIKAVLGPTNTGKTHLAIERLCAHSSGAIGFPLRLLAREVYDKVCAIKGPNHVALITGEEQIIPKKQAKWLLCTVEAMPVDRDLAFVALDEAQLAADRERGHIFTDRLLNARGREETMILGSATLEPALRKLVPEAEIVGRPRFSTLSHLGARKLSRVPPRSVIVAFSSEQVYAVAELLKRFRGGAAVVMGALSPETRNRQVELFQSGEVDYLVATDAIGMGLNLDVGHVAFAGLSKFDGERQRRLTTAEMAQIAGRAGRHQRDGTFGTLAGTASGSGASHDAEFTAEEVYAIEEHRFPPLTKLNWREPEPDCGSLAGLIADLERPPEHERLAPAPEALDLAVLKLLATDPAIADPLKGETAIRRFWEVCRLPDFRAHGTDTHARFVTRLWQDLRGGHLGADYIANAIAELDRPEGDIDTLQMRIAAIRSWAYIAQRPDWVLARDEMAARARAAEARLSDALHGRLTERFVNRRTSLLMRRSGVDAGLLPVTLEGDAVLIEGQEIGQLTGFRFTVDSAVALADRKLLLAAAERHLPALRAQRAAQLLAALTAGEAELALKGSRLCWDGEALATLTPGRSALAAKILLDKTLERLSAQLRGELQATFEAWLARALAPLTPLHELAEVAAATETGPELRAVLLRLIEHGGMVARKKSGFGLLTPPQREALRKLGVWIGGMDVFVPKMLRPGPLAAWQALAAARGQRAEPPHPVMPSVLAQPFEQPAPPGYHRFGAQAVRVDMAERVLRASHDRRRARHGGGKKGELALDPTFAVSIGLTKATWEVLLRDAGFQVRSQPPLSEEAFGPPSPPLWRWAPEERPSAMRPGPRVAEGNPFAELIKQGK
jgi:ATP-dependent RNA helicase SUPV3L1/SUV3